MYSVKGINYLSGSFFPLDNDGMYYGKSEKLNENYTACSNDFKMSSFQQNVGVQNDLSTNLLRAQAKITPTPVTVAIAKTTTTVAAVAITCTVKVISNSGNDAASGSEWACRQEQLHTQL